MAGTDLLQGALTHVALAANHSYIETSQQRVRGTVRSGTLKPKVTNNKPSVSHIRRNSSMFPCSTVHLFCNWYQSVPTKGYFLSEGYERL